MISQGFFVLSASVDKISFRVKMIPRVLDLLDDVYDEFVLQIRLRKTRFYKILEFVSKNSYVHLIREGSVVPILWPWRIDVHSSVVLLQTPVLTSPQFSAVGYMNFLIIDLPFYTHLENVYLIKNVCSVLGVETQPRLLIVTNPNNNETLPRSANP